MLRLRPHPDVVSRTLEGEVVLVHLRTNKIFALNETGARLWQLLDGTATIEAAEAQLLDEYDVEPTALRREVRDLVEQLQREELVLRD